MTNSHLFPLFPFFKPSPHKIFPFCISKPETTHFTDKTQTLREKLQNHREAKTTKKINVEKFYKLRMFKYEKEVAAKTAKTLNPKNKSTNQQS